MLHIQCVLRGTNTEEADGLKIICDVCPGLDSERQRVRHRIGLTRDFAPGRQLRAFPPGIVRLADNLHELNMDLHSIAGPIPEELGLLKHLTFLSFCGTEATSLPQSIAKLENLGKLFAFGSALTSIPSDLLHLPNICEVNLNGNKIEEWAPSTSECPPALKLERLKLAGNRLHTLDPAVCACTALTHLILNGNRLDFIPDALGDYCHLEMLMLQGNCLKAIPDSLIHLERLKELNLAENQLEDFPDNVALMPSLSRLWLYSNRRESITLKDTTTTRCDLHLWVESNPLSRDAVQSLLNFASFHPDAQVFLDDSQLQDVEHGEFSAKNHLPPSVHTGHVIHEKGYYKLVSALKTIWKDKKSEKSGFSVRQEQSNVAGKNYGRSGNQKQFFYA